MRTIIRRHVARLVACLALTAIPGALYAQSSGPLQPEYEGGAAPEGPQVNPFNGGFSFGLPVMNIPGPDGSGYSVALSYQSGASPEHEVSWVGYGWSLNAGAIVRNVQGYPDDWDDTVTIWNKRDRDWTVSGIGRLGAEVNSHDLLTSLVDTSVFHGASLSVAVNTIYNNYDGYERTIDYNADTKGIAGFGVTAKVTGDYTSWTPRIQPGIFDLGVHDCFNRLFKKPTMPFIAPRFSGSSVNCGLTTLLGIPSYTISGAEFGVVGNVTIRNLTDTYRVPIRGYMYTHGAPDDALLDYSLERLIPFHPDHRMLPVPFTGADNYYITGNGGGAFRLYSRGLGNLHPDKHDNPIAVTQVQPDLIFGLSEIGIGGAFGLGNVSLDVSQWEDEGKNAAYQFSQMGSGDEPFFFRFMGDGAGNQLASATDAPANATFEDGAPKVPADIMPALNNGDRVPRNSYIGFNLNRELRDTTDKGKHYRTFGTLVSQLPDSSDYINRNEVAIRNQIGEIAVIGAGGSRSVYGLPVYSRNERRLGFGVQKTVEDSASRAKANSMVYSWADTGSARICMGEERESPYATAYLLTQITTPNYIDISHDGPTPDDVGGYVIFKYDHGAGTDRKQVVPPDSAYTRHDRAAPRAWFHWRSPYNGLNYDRGDLSDPKDDIGTYSSGEREQYYLRSIETKTHIAIFVSNLTSLTFPTHNIYGSGARRRDGYEMDSKISAAQAAGDSTASSAKWNSVNDGYEQAYNLSRRLERIELYTKDASGNPDSLISTVFFDYDYSLRPGMINSMTAAHDSTARAGMLTLKRVWWQNQRVYNARIAPYEFGYEYPHATDYPAAMRTKYPAIVHFADSLSSSEQNPPYSLYDFDRWGMYQDSGRARHAAGLDWTNQRPDANRFDPAAWQLKTIRTPSRGQMQVQYEQDDYNYVQDKPALSMVSLLGSFNGSSCTDNESEGKYWLNLGDLGVSDTDRATVFRYQSMMKKLYLDTNDRIYLKFLYALAGDTAHWTNPAYNSAQVRAYARVHSLQVDSMSSGGHMHYALAVDIQGGAYSVPKQACEEFVKKRKRGRLVPYDPVSPDGSAMAAVSAITWKYSEAAFDHSAHCRAVDYVHSYMRIPVLAPKLGGGIRVKRLLAMDPGIEGDSMLYGTEYIYKVYDPERKEYISSGVAANEPNAGREENALVNVDLVRGRADWANKIIAGEDIQEFEGPVGEALLPGASVGYSRVVTRNIHAGKTNPGFSVQEFFTTRDYPLNRYDSITGRSVDYTPIANDTVSENPLFSSLESGTSGLKTEVSKLGGSFVNDLPPIDGRFKREVNDVNQAQGYRFILNGMNGQPKSSAAYGGKLEDPDSWALSGLTQYEYYQPGEKIPLLDRVGDSIRYDYVGKQTDVTMDSRAIQDHSVDGYVSARFTVPYGTWTPPKWSVGGTLDLLENNWRTHVINKVIHYPAITKRVLTYGDGIYHMAESVAFDPVSGAPVLSRTTDSYDRLALEYAPSGQNGAYNSYSFMATNEYPALGSKAANMRAVIESTGGLSITKTAAGGGAATLSFSPAFGSAAYAAMAKLWPGDLIRLVSHTGDTARGWYRVASVGSGTASLTPVSTVFAKQDTSHGVVNVEVLESGRGDMQGSAVGGIVTYGETPTAVRTAANFGKTNPSGFNQRQKLADTLNAVLARGGGLVLPATVSSCGAIFKKSLSDHDTCIALPDTIWLAVRDGKVIVNRGDIRPHQAIAGSHASPHALVTHLNHYLDTLWGFRIASTAMYRSQCDSGNYTYRHYSTDPASYRAVLDSMESRRFDSVNYLDNYWIGDLVRTGPGMDTLTEAFRRGTDTNYSATGMIDLHGVLNTNTIRNRLWASECDSGGNVKKISLRHAHELDGDTQDTTYTYTTFTLADLNARFPYTTYMGFFGETDSGYLTYKHAFGTAVEKNAFGIRFIHGDTTINHLACSDTLARPGNVGRFELDDDGTLVFTAPSLRGGFSHVVPACIGLCPTVDRRYRTHSRVIAAGAVLVNDSVNVQSSSAYTLPVDAGAYDVGTLGKPRASESYVYRTEITGGAMSNISDTATTERNYRNAGVFTSFRLFNWARPWMNDTVAWMKSDTVLRYSLAGIPLETRSPLGIYGAVQLGYSDRLPVMAAANASYGSFGFQSFEADTALTYVERGEAHSGRYMIALRNNTARDPNLHYTMTSQTRAKGVLLKFWMKTEATLASSGTPTIKALFKPGSGSDITANVWASNQIARTGEWRLMEVFFRDTTISLGTAMTITFKRPSDTNVVFLDDIKVQPADAVASCQVYDGRTFRVIASFDDTHFGTYPQYNAEGEAVRAIVETERGYRTVAESHGHVPLVSRSGDGGSTIAGRHGDGAERMLRSNGVNGGTPEGEGVGGKFDILNIEAGPNGVKKKVLGVDPDRLKLPQVKAPELKAPELKAPAVDDPSKLVPENVKPENLSPEAARRLEELKRLNARREELLEREKGALSDEERAKVEEELKAIEARRAEIVGAGLP
ncbi:MAG: hypothetical protein JST22_21430 [Bacteroidetes bacterium]|nr:hypothetical protein [Bacteroidota bacterium]